MGALIGQPDFPIDFLRPTRISFDTVGNEVDGGVKTDNIAEIAAAGADTFVAGSAIFGKPDYRKVIDEMRAALATVERS